VVKALHDCDDTICDALLCCDDLTDAHRCRGDNCFARRCSSLVDYCSAKRFCVEAFRESLIWMGYERQPPPVLHHPQGGYRRPADVLCCFNTWPRRLVLVGFWDHTTCKLDGRITSARRHVGTSRTGMGHVCFGSTLPSPASRLREMVLGVDSLLFARILRASGLPSRHGEANRTPRCIFLLFGPFYRFDLQRDVILTDMPVRCEQMLSWNSQSRACFDAGPHMHTATMECGIADRSLLV
jgi:hypothetical protein